MPLPKTFPKSFRFPVRMKYECKTILHTAKGKCKHTEGPTLLLSLKYSTGKQHYMSAGYTNLCTNEEC